jgi:autotransporter-associated beta strand protein
MFPSSTTTTGSITFGDSIGTGDLTFTGNLTRSTGFSNRVVNVAGTTTVTFNGNLLSPGTGTNAPRNTTTFTKGGTGTLAIKGFTAAAADGGFSNVIVSGGTLAVTRLANQGIASSLGRATYATSGAASITLDGGELSYIDGGAAASSTDRLLQIGRTTAGGTGTIRNNATNSAETVTFSNTSAIAYGTVDQTRTLVLGGTNTGANIVASVIGNNGTGNVTLTKQHAGTWVLSGTNTYAGATSIAGGTLTLSDAGSVNNSSDITVNGSGAKLLQNSSVAVTPTVTLTQGTVTGNGFLNTVTVGAGTGGIITNNNGVAGAALTIGTLNFSGAATVNTFHTAGDFATTVATSTLSTNAAGNVTLNPSASFWTNGTYSLLSYTGSVGGAGAGQVVLGTVLGLSARQIPSLVDSGSAFNLTISGDTPKWTGLDNGNWQTGTTGANKNWVLQVDGTPVDYLANDVVLFDDSATGATTIDINAANVSPFATTFNNTTKNYTLSSTGGFGIASGPLTKTGSGTLTITNSNRYTGDTVINGGVLDVSTDGAQIYNGPAGIVSTVTVTNGGVLVVRNYGQEDTSGLGSPSLGNLNNTGGQVILDGGTLRFNGETNFCDRKTNIGEGGGTLDVTNNSAPVFFGSGIFIFSGASALTLTGDSTSSGTIQGIIAGTGVSVIKSGNATWTLQGANTYNGATTVTAGTLELVGGSQASPVTLSAGASLGFDISSPTTSTSTFNLSAGTIKIIGLPIGSAHTLISNSAGITGTPVLDAPIVGYQLKVVGNSLILVKDGYPVWAAVNGAGANLNDDHDNDGVPNGVEYFLGGPNGNTTGSTALPGVTNTAGTLSVTWVMGAGYAGIYGTDFTVETSDTLTGMWTTESSPGTVTITGSNVTYTFPAPLGSKKFARLKVTGP